MVTDGVDSATASVAAGQVTLALSTAGARTLTATYQGDTSFNASPASAGASHQVNGTEISVKGAGNTITDGDSSPSPADNTDFGNATVGASGVVRAFSIENSGNIDLDLTGAPNKVVVGGTHAAEFQVTQVPSSPVAPAGSTTFQVTFTPGGLGLRTATLSIDNTDSNENPYNFTIQGTGVCPTITVTNPATTTATTGVPFSQTFTQSGGVGTTTFGKTGPLPAGLSLSTAGVLSGTPGVGTSGSYSIVVTATDSFNCTGSGATYTLVVSDPPPIAPVGFTIGGTPSDATTGSGAPDPTGAASIGSYDTQVRGAFLAQNGNLVFPAHLLITNDPPVVTVDNFQGLWKDDGSGLKLIARSGSPAPGASGALWDILPMIPAITDSGDVTFFASLRVGSPTVTGTSDTALWTQIGGGGLKLLLREGDSIAPAISGANVSYFGSGAFATATLSPTTGTAAYPVNLTGSTTDSAIIRSNINGSTITHTLVARENSPAPGTTENFYHVGGGYSDPCRMDAQGNLSFAAFIKPSYKQGIWYQANGGALTKVVLSGDVAPDTGGATFYPNYLDMPAMGGNGTLAFHAFLNGDGDNSAGGRGEGVWRGNTTSGFTCILRMGDTNALRPGLGLPSGSKIGNMTSPWLSNANHVALTAWVDLNGDGFSNYGTDVVGLFSDTSGTMKLVLKEGDAVPGVAGAVFTRFEPPVIGGQEQMAFMGRFSGPGVNAGTNDTGIWREAPNGGAPVLILRAGDSMTTAQGVKTIAKVDMPGTSQGGYPADHRWEQQVMDGTGTLIINVTFTDGSTSQVLAAGASIPPT